MIKAITFDLWGTLIKGSPEYKEARAKYIQEHCENHSIEEINKTIVDIKRSYDDAIEKHGIHYTSLVIYQTIINELGIHQLLDGFGLRGVCHNLFIKYPPKLYSEDTLKSLENLSKQVPLVLISNTVLIDGGILRPVIETLGIGKYFKAMIFSSDVHMSKPNPLIYKKAHEMICQRKEHILHVGDNLITDYNGATEYGFKAKRINTSRHNIKTIEFLLNNENTLVHGDN